MRNDCRWDGVTVTKDGQMRTLRRRAGICRARKFDRICAENVNPPAADALGGVPVLAYVSGFLRSQERLEKGKTWRP